MPPAALAGLDAWREAQPDKPNRPEAARRLIAKAIAADSRPSIAPWPDPDALPEPWTGPGA